MPVPQPSSSTSRIVTPETPGANLIPTACEPPVPPKSGPDSLLRRTPVPTMRIPLTGSRLAERYAAIGFTRCAAPSSLCSLGS